MSSTTEHKLPFRRRLKACGVFNAMLQLRMVAVPCLKAEVFPEGCVGVPCKIFIFDLQESFQLQADESTFPLEIFQDAV